jgi:hypothetical protein
MEPAPAGLTDQVTAVLPVFVTIAENCWVWLAYRLAVGGDTATATGGSRVTTAEANFVGSAWLVAVTVTFWAAEMAPGAVYNPAALIEPAPAGLIDHVTAVLLTLVTVAENCCA